MAQSGSSKWKASRLVFADKNQVKPGSQINNICEVSGGATPPSITLRSMDDRDDVTLTVTYSGDFQVGFYYRVMVDHGWYFGVTGHPQKIAAPSDAGADTRND